MTPILLASNNKKRTTSYLKKFLEKHVILPYHMFLIEPENKEITIDQIREIKKQVSYGFSEPRLFVLESFEKASYPAQNALLKTLEEHNDNVFFILIVNGLYSVLDTIRSRSTFEDIRVTKDAEIDKTLETSLTKLMKDPSPKELSSSQFQVKTQEDASSLFDTMLSYFRNRLDKDTHATSLIRLLIKSKSEVTNNNVNPQYAVDHVLIVIHKTYQTI